MPRNSAPTSSIGCSALSRRSALKLALGATTVIGAPAILGRATPASAQAAFAGEGLIVVSWSGNHELSFREAVVKPFNVAYCGNGVMAACAASLWQAIHDTAETLTTQQSQADPHLWKKLANTTGFIPGLLPNRFPTTNRPTFQQVLEFDRIAP